MYLAYLAAAQNLCAKRGPNKKRGATMFGFRGQVKGWAVAAILLGLSVPAHAGDARSLYASLGDTTRAPIGWVEFCADSPGECGGGASQPRDIVMTQTAWRDLL